MKKQSILTDEERRKAIDEIIAFFAEERGEEIGIVAGGQVLDFFSNDIGTLFYRKGINAAQKLIKQRLEDLDVDLDLLTTK